MPAFLKQFGITRRSTKESLINYVAHHGIPTNITNTKYKQGWHVDWIGIKHFYRSSYEYEMYQILDKKKKHYQTENLKIRYYDTQTNTYRIAIPDINIDKLIIEIKSKYTFDEINMNDRFNAYRSLGYRPMLLLNKKWRPWKESNFRTEV